MILCHTFSFDHCEIRGIVGEQEINFSFVLGVKPFAFVVDVVTFITKVVVKDEKSFKYIFYVNLFGQRFVHLYLVRVITI